MSTYDESKYSCVVRVVYAATGRAVRADAWGEPQTPLFQFVGGLEDGEQGPMQYLVDCAGEAGVLPVEWLAVSFTRELLIKTRKGYRRMVEVIA